MDEKSTNIASNSTNVLETQEKRASYPGYKMQGLNHWKPTRPYLLRLGGFISGAILGLSMPGYNLSFLAWVGFIPLLLILSKIKNTKQAVSSSFFFGLGFNLVALNWLLFLHPLNWIGITTFWSVILVNSIWITVAAYSSIFIALFGLTVTFIMKSRINMFLKSILIAFSWSIATNFLMSFGHWAFPWSMIEYSQYKNLSFLQYAQFIKGIGIGEVIIIFNSLIALNIINFLDKNCKLKPVLYRFTAIIAGITIIYLGGFCMLFIPQTQSKTTTVTVVQSGSTIEQSKSGQIPEQKINNYFLKEIKNAPSGLIVIPEGAIFDYLRFYNQKLYDNFISIVQKENKTLIIGTADVVNKNNKYLPTNAVITLDKSLNNHSSEVYNKQSLVPFGEYLPFRDILPANYRNTLKNTLGDDYYRGQEIKVIPTSIGNIAPSVCYEIIFPKMTAIQKNKSADILVNLSNLAWFHDSIIKDQFVAFGVMRAAESRKPLIASVNSGYSIIIQNNGKILKKFPKNKFITESVILNYD